MLGSKGVKQFAVILFQEQWIKYVACWTEKNKKKQKQKKQLHNEGIYIIIRKKTYKVVLAQ